MLLIFYISSFQQGIGVELIRILPETHPPQLTNIFAEADSKDDVVSISIDLGFYFLYADFKKKYDLNESNV